MTECRLRPDQHKLGGRKANVGWGLELASAVGAVKAD